MYASKSPSPSLDGVGESTSICYTYVLQQLTMCNDKLISPKLKKLMGEYWIDVENSHFRDKFIVRRYFHLVYLMY